MSMGSFSEYTDQEFGFPAPAPTPVVQPGMPRGNARIPVPHPATFSGITNLAAHAYYWAFDEAVAHNRENARRSEFDPVVTYCRMVRSYAISLIPFHAEPDDPDD